MTKEAYMTKTAELLRHMGVTPNYTGFYQTVYMVSLVLHQPDRLLHITKWLYPDAAKHCQTTAKAIDRNVRTIIQVAWKNNPLMLSVLAGYPLQSKPRPTQFISSLACAVSGLEQREAAAALPDKPPA